jgi:hypothetical protein
MTLALYSLSIILRYVFCTSLESLWWVVGFVFYNKPIFQQIHGRIKNKYKVDY